MTRCSTRGCHHHAIYAACSGEKATRCAIHRERGWYDTKSRLCVSVDAASKRKCCKRATFAAGRLVPERLLRGTLPRALLPKPIWCRTHAPASAVDVRTTRCLYCSKGAYYFNVVVEEAGPPARRRLCKEHATRRCATVGAQACRRCGAALPSVTDGDFRQRICVGCLLFRGSTQTLRLPSSARTVEHAVVVHVMAWVRRASLITAAHQGFRASFNTTVRGTRFRPDILMQCAHGFVVVEVDERQHAAYKRHDEEARMRDIAVALRRPVTFLRFNPHSRRRPTLATFQHRIDALLVWITWLLVVPAPPNAPHARAIYINYGAD